MPSKELTDYVAAEREGDAAVVLAPTGYGRVGVGPEDVAEEAGVGDVAGSHDVSDLFHLTKFRTQPPMHTNNLIINNSRTRQTIKSVTELFPNFNRKTTAALVVETVDAVYAGALVVAAEDEEVFWVLYFISEEEADYFEGLFAAVDVVAEEEVVGFGGEASIFEQPKHIRILSMNIPTNFNRRPQLQKHRLGEKNVPGFVTELSGVCDGDFDGGAGLFVAGREELFDHTVDPGVVGSGGHGGGRGSFGRDGRRGVGELGFVFKLGLIRKDVKVAVRHGIILSAALRVVGTVGFELF